MNNLHLVRASIVINKNNLVLDGGHRVEALKRLGCNSAFCLVFTGDQNPFDTPRSRDVGDILDPRD